MVRNNHHCHLHLYLLHFRVPQGRVLIEDPVDTFSDQLVVKSCFFPFLFCIFFYFCLKVIFSITVNVYCQIQSL